MLRYFKDERKEETNEKVKVSKGIARQAIYTYRKLRMPAGKLRATPVYCYLQRTNFGTSRVLRISTFHDLNFRLDNYFNFLQRSL